MFSYEPKTVYEAIKPLAYFNGFLGLSILRTSNQSRLSYYFIQLQIVIVNMMNWTLVYMGLIELMQNEDANSDGPPMARTMYRVLICTNSCIVVIGPLLSWLQKKGLRNCLQQIEVLNGTFQSILGIENNYNEVYILLKCGVMAICIIMLMVATLDFVLAPHTHEPLLLHLGILVTQHQPIAVMFLMDVNFCIFVRYIKKRLEALNNFLQEMVTKSATSNSSDKLFVTHHNIVRTTPCYKITKIQVKSLKSDQHLQLKEVRKIHWELCKLARQMNVIFGVQNLLSMGLSFILVTGLLYTIYCTFKWDMALFVKIRKILPVTSWTAIYTFQIWFICHSCWTVSNEAERCGKIIYHLLTPKVNDEVLELEIEKFAVQMLQNPVKFTACEFFTIDYGHIRRVIGTITTYLVILIQMSQHSQSSILNSIPTNETKA